MKRFIISLVCIILCINIVSTTDAKMVSKLSSLDNNSDVYKLDSNEFMGRHKKCLIEFFNKRTQKSKAGLVNGGEAEKVLVIPMEFKDVKFKRDNKDYEDLLERLKEYYELNSCYEKGKIGITIEYTIIDKIASKYDMKHYATNMSTGINDEDISVDEMAKDAIGILQEKGFNFEEYDKDQDGIIDHIIIIHAGIGQEENGDKDFIWSHHYVIQNDGIKVGNVVALNYTTVPENAKLGVIAHEFGHDLGLPDLYDTYRSNQGAGSWDIMASGSYNYKKDQLIGECPSNLSCWCREYLRWGKIEEVDESGELVFKNTNGISNVYKIYLRDKYGRKNTNEYYLLEYRRKINYDESLPGEGILIWHIDEDSIQEKLFLNYLNSDSYKMGVSLVQADGKFHLTSEDDYNRGDEGDPFPGNNPYNIFGAIPNKLNFDNNGNYSFVEGRNFKLDGDTATMYIDLDVKAPCGKIETYAPLDESMVSNRIVFCCDMVPKCSEYKLQISNNEEFLFPLQYNISGDDHDIEVIKDKILFSEDFDGVLQEENEYYWRIAAVNPLTSMENLVWSTPKRMVYMGNRGMNAPSNVRFEVKDDNIKISWACEGSAVGYVVLCNEKEIYTKTNTLEIKNDELEYRVRVRSIGELSASELGDEFFLSTLKKPSIKANVVEPCNDLVLPEYIILEIENGTFKESGNYNESTIDIDKLPVGIRQGEISWLNEKMVKVNLDTKYSYVLDCDSKFKVTVSKNLIDDFYGDDLKAEFTLQSNNKSHIDKLKFSFSGEDAKKIIGIKKGMEYSIDGGLTYKECEKNDMILDDEQIESLNEVDGIIARTDGGKYYVVSILENNRNPIVIPDFSKNILRGLTSDMEYSFDGVNWISYKEDLEKIENKIWVRYKGYGRVKASDSVLFEFSGDIEQQEKDNKSA